MKYQDPVKVWSIFSRQFFQVGDLKIFSQFEVETFETFTDIRAPMSSVETFRHLMKIAYLPLRALFR